MIFLRILMDKIPDNWEPHIVWYLAGIETLIDVLLIVLLYVVIKR